MRLRIAAILFGAGFGFMLGWAGFADPEVIHTMLRLRAIDVFLIMGSAIATATIGTRLLKASGWRAWADGAPITWKTLRPAPHHVLGSALFGLGWSLSNACPGPIAVQLGRGEWSALFTALGFMGGIALRDVWTERAASAAAVESAMCGDPAR